MLPFPHVRYDLPRLFSNYIESRHHKSNRWSETPSRHKFQREVDPVLRKVISQIVPLNTLLVLYRTRTQSVYGSVNECHQLSSGRASLAGLITLDDAVHRYPIARVSYFAPCLVLALAPAPHGFP